MIIVGVTGSIGMGKSTVTSQFEALGAKTCNADTIVHKLLETDAEVLAQIQEHFPQAVEGNAINRAILGKIVFPDTERRKQLEAILHPRVQAVENEFIEKNRVLGTKVVALDIPLLFETGGEKRCDITVVASAPACVQRWRVMRRPGMTKEKFDAILKNQMPDKEKRQRATFVVATGFGKSHSFRQVKKIMKAITHA